jgi:hypothetical protein
MNYRILLIFCILISTARAQTAADSVFTASIKLTKGSVRTEVVYADSSWFLVLSEEQSQSNELNLLAYSTDRTMVWNRKVDMASIDLEQRYRGWIVMDSGFILLTSGFEREKKQMIVYGTRYSFSGDLVNAPVVLHTLPLEAKSPDYLMGWSVSPDKKSLLVYLQDDEELNLPVRMKSLNGALDVEWEKELLLPYSENILGVKRFLMDNSRGVYIITGDAPTKSAGAFDEVRSGRYVVYYYNYDKNRLKEYDASLKDKTVVAVDCALRPTGELVIGGYYGHEGERRASGVFIFELAAQGARLRRAAYMPFPEDFLQSFADGRRNVRNKGVPHLYLDGLIIHADSTVSLIGEQFLLVENIVGDIGTGRQLVEYIYHFDDIVVTRLGAEGNLLWNARVPKQQYAYSNDPSCSYTAYSSENSGLCFYFNDESGNNEATIEDRSGIAKAWSSARLGVTTEVCMDRNGRSKRRRLVDNGRVRYVLKPKESAPINSSFRVLGFEDDRTVRYFPMK